MTTSQRITRFDDVYKLLLTLLTVLISFIKDFLRPIAIFLLSLYVIALTIWILGHLIGKIEYDIKLYGWYWLVLSLFSSFYRVIWSTEVIGQPITAITFGGSAGLFLLMLAYLWSYVRREAKIVETIAVIFYALFFSLVGW